MSYILNAFILFFLSILTIGLFPYVSFYNTVPFLPLSFVLAISYFRKGFEPILLSALAGLFIDVFSGYGFGFYTIFFLVSAVTVRTIFHEGLNHISFIRYTIINIIAFATLFLVQVMGLYLEKSEFELFSLILPFLIFVIINLLGSFVLFFGINRYFDKLIELDLRRRRS